MLPLDHVIALSAILFTIGVLGVATRRNLIVMMMSIELMLNSANMAFLGFNRVWSQVEGAPTIDAQVFVLIVIGCFGVSLSVSRGSGLSNKSLASIPNASMIAGVSHPAKQWSRTFPLECFTLSDGVRSSCAGHCHIPLPFDFMPCSCKAASTIASESRA